MAAGICVVAGWTAWPQSPAATAPSFEVASIKPNHSGDRMVSMMNAPGGRFTAKNVTAKMLIRLAYAIQDFQIAGGPSWMDSERYDIEAKPEGSSGEPPAGDHEALMEQQRLRIQALLADRFRLTIHRESKELPVYALVEAKGGPRVQPAAVVPAVFKGRGMRMGRGELTAQSAPMSQLAESLSIQIGRTVVDRTGLAGVYDFTLKWTPDENQPQMFPGPREGSGPPPDRATTPDNSSPSIFTAIEEQLGLKLESQKGPVPIVVIDRIEKPSEN
jgi:bla regulator protein blaR1